MQSVPQPFCRVCYYTTSNKTTEFGKFLDYRVKFSKMRTGNDVKKLYSDYFSTYMDDTKVTLALRDPGIWGCLDTNSAEACGA